MIGSKYNMHIVIILLSIISWTYSTDIYKFDVCDENSSVALTEGVHLPTGEIVFDGVTYQSNEFYVDNVTGIERGCVCKKEYCLRKCCPLGYAYEINTKKCINISEPFDPPAWEPNVEKPSVSTDANRLFRFVPGELNCKVRAKSNKRLRVSRMKRYFYLGTDGRLYIMEPEKIPPWLIKGPENYCIDTFVYEDPSTGAKMAQLDAFICFNKKEDKNHYILSSTGMLISCVFILATVAVYGWLPELHNLHGRVLMVYLMCLFVGFLLLAIMQILLTVNNISVNACLSMTFVIYFFLVAGFFWLNVMSFDIWWTFSGNRGMSLENMSIKACFISYALYAFGFSTALTALLITLEFSGIPPHPLLPSIKDHGCFISGTRKLLYLYGPITILCVANLIFFVLTAMKITQIKNQTSVLKSRESSKHDQQRNDKQRLLLYVKLFVVMGFNWILEVISALYPEAEMFWRFTDLYNVLIGVFVFIIFVCKKKIFKLIKKRYKQLRGDPISRTQTMTSSRTYSSRDEVPLGSVKIKCRNNG